MNIHFSSRPQKTLLFLILSYVAIMCIPTITIIALNRQANDIVEQEADRASSAILTQIRLSVDTRIDDVYKQAMQIGSSDRVTACMFMGENPSGADYYSIYQLQRELSGYQAINTWIKDFAVYFKRSDIMVSSRSSYAQDLHIAYDTLYRSPSMSFDVWRALLRDRGGRRFVPVYSDAEQTELDGVMYLQSFSAQGQNLVTILLYIDASLFEVLIHDIGLEDYYDVTIATLEEGAFFSSDMKIGQEISAGLSLAENAAHHRVMLDQRSFTVNTVMSDKNDWIYIMSLPMEEHLHKRTYLQQITLYAMLGCTVVGLLAAIVFSWRNYSPIARLVSTISEKTEIPFGESHSEMNYIRMAMLNVIDENDAIATRLSDQKATMTGHLTARLLNGDLGTEGIRLLQWNDMIFDVEVFAVVLVARHEALGVEGDGEARQPEDQQLMYRQLKLIVPSLCGDTCKAYLTETPQGVACLLNILDRDVPDAHALIADWARALQQAFVDQYAQTPTIAVSDVHHAIAGIPAAYQETREALDYMTQENSGEILIYEDSATGDGRHSYRLRKESAQLLANYVHAGDAARAGDLADALFAENVASQHASLAEMRLLALDISFIAIRSVRETGDDLAELSEMTAISQLAHLSSMAAIQEATKRQVMHIAKHIALHVDAQANPILDDMLGFIAQEMGNPDLSVAMIAERFAMSPTSMSRYFKRQTGEGLLDYINRYRVQRSKQYLRDNTLSIKAIGQRVGFVNSNTYIRVFRKYEGITPGIYRTFEKTSF